MDTENRIAREHRPMFGTFALSRGENDISCKPNTRVAYSHLMYGLITDKIWLQHWAPHIKCYWNVALLTNLAAYFGQRGLSGNKDSSAAVTTGPYISCPTQSASQQCRPTVSICVSASSDVIFSA
jgi:hypothetical protein